MLVIFFIWIVISIVLYSCGSLFNKLYNCICKKDERYNILDTILLGIPFLLILLPLLSFCFPINTTILGILTLTSILYCLINKKRLYTIESIKDHLKTYTKADFVFICIFSLSFIYIVAWGISNFDSAYYHHQNQRWIEEFAIVPGLANLEERIGFNSNYFILNAPFTFRFLLNEAQFAIQGLLAFGVLLWIFSEIIKSRYAIKQVILLFIYLVFIAINLTTLGDSSTDIPPNLIIFYLISKLILYPPIAKKEILLYIVVLATAITFKLSIAFVLLICIIPLIHLFRNREIKCITFLACTILVIWGLWIARNTITSGYLIFPLYEIDIFNFDWKVPQEIAIQERTYIKQGALWQLRFVHEKSIAFLENPSIKFINNYIYFIIYGLIAISPIPFIVLFLKRKLKEIYPLFSIYILLCIAALLGFYQGPDFRFISGILFSIIFVPIAAWFSIYPNFSIQKYKAAYLSSYFILFLISITIWVQSAYTPDISLKTIKNIVVRPRKYNEKIANFKDQTTYDIYKLLICLA